jgi:hypothetical protein
MLASVSPELAASVIENPIIIGESAFRVFVVWLLYRTFDNVEAAGAIWINQASLAEAWGLGADYHIPAFQNAVMDMLLFAFSEEIIDPRAVKAAYRTTKRNTKLQLAFIYHIVQDSHGGHLAWRREDYTDSGMNKVPGFCLDMAVWLGAELGAAMLVDEDNDKDDSVTEG